MATVFGRKTLIAMEAKAVPLIITKIDNITDQDFTGHHDSY